MQKLSCIEKQVGWASCRRVRPHLSLNNIQCFLRFWRVTLTVTKLSCYKRDDFAVLIIANLTHLRSLYSARACQETNHIVNKEKAFQSLVVVTVTRPKLKSTVYFSCKLKTNLDKVNQIQFSVKLKYQIHWRECNAFDLIS